jgi:hypothetical protein
MDVNPLHKEVGFKFSLGYQWTLQGTFCSTTLMKLRRNTITKAFVLSSQEYGMNYTSRPPAWEAIPQQLHIGSQQLTSAPIVSPQLKNKSFPVRSTLATHFPAHSSEPDFHWTWPLFFPFSCSTFVHLILFLPLSCIPETIHFTSHTPEVYINPHYHSNCNSNNNHLQSSPSTTVWILISSLSLTQTSTCSWTSEAFESIKFQHEILRQHQYGHHELPQLVGDSGRVGEHGSYSAHIGHGSGRGSPLGFLRRQLSKFSLQWIFTHKQSCC